MSVRIDKWLWAARFFKTRTRAALAVSGGKVLCNGKRVKPALDIRPGDQLAVTIEGLTWTVAVLALSEQRGPASVAALLYAESDESRAARQALQEARRTFPDPASQMHGRPTKRNRRLMHRFVGEG